MRPSPPRSSTACSTTATSSAFGASRFACARRASWSHPPDRADPGRPIGRGTRFEGLRSPPSGSHLPPNPEIDPVRPKAAPTSPRSGRTPRPYGPLHPAAPPTSKPRSTRGELSGHQWGFLLALDNTEPATARVRDQGAVSVGAEPAATHAQRKSSASDDLGCCRYLHVAN